MCAQNRIINHQNNDNGSDYCSNSGNNANSSNHLQNHNYTHNNATNNSNNTNVCNNCGKQGHQFHQCKLPITSYGIILFRSSDKGPQFLMIRRKDSFGYIDFIRGKYMPNNLEHLQSMFNEMSVNERAQIEANEFDTLWRKMWGESYNLYQYKNEESLSRRKFEMLRKGVVINTVEVSLRTLINESKTSWNETEWEFPKGRRNFQEKDLECALREFEEETGYRSSDVTVIENLMPFEEIFIGSNHKSYKHKYFVGFSDKINGPFVPSFQKSEVSKLEWKTVDECNDSIRPYNLEKKKLIVNISRILKEYRLYR